MAYHTPLTSSFSELCARPWKTWPAADRRGRWKRTRLHRGGDPASEVFHYQRDEEFLPSGKHTKNYGKSPFLMGQSTISTGPFSIAMLVYQRVSHETRLFFDLRCLNIFDIRLCWWNPMGFNGELPIPVSWLQKPMESVTILAVKYTVWQRGLMWSLWV